MLLDVSLCTCREVRGLGFGVWFCRARGILAVNAEPSARFHLVSGGMGPFHLF